MTEKSMVDKKEWKWDDLLVEPKEPQWVVMMALKMAPQLVGEMVVLKVGK